jgi:ribosomal protein S18 acetylase RimI-like enzyme
MIAGIAKKTWPIAYAVIISPQQIQYMLDTLYETEELRRVIRDKSQKFLVLKDNQEYPGFIAFGPRKDDPSRYKIHKLYVLPTHHGKGYGKLLIEEVKRQLSALHIETLDLNVNRNNPAVEFYKNVGFSIVGEEDIPIGAYWMNDYVMRMKI